ncbi:MAG: hypothetical protein RXO24_07390 [Acidilobus sp.]
MSSTNKNKEVSPEALLEQLRNAKTTDDVFDLFEELWSLIMGIILKADTDTNTKTHASHQIGLLSARFYILLDAYKVAVEHDFSYRDELHDEIEDDLEKLIEVYAYLKKGGLLKKAIDTISWVSVSAENRVKDFMNYLAQMVEDLSPRPYY